MILKAILYENQAIYIVSSVGNQSKETFGKIEEIDLNMGKTAASIKSLKDIIAKETKKSPNNKTGFSHASEGYHVEFYNGSEIFTLNGNPDNNRSKNNYYVFIMKNKSKREEIIMNRWTENEIDFLRKNFGILNPEEISKKMGRTYSSIAHKASRENIVPHFKWTDIEIQILKDNYKIKTYKELVALLPNRTKTAIDVKINKLGLHKEKHTYNRRFFENINTEDKAYWLGFFYADGCVSINEETNSGEAAIKLYKGDYKHLKKFNKSLEGNINVSFETRICNLNNKPQESCIIRCYSIDMVNDLIKIGCIPNKTFYITVPNIPKPLMRHFIRGFFDGDGCICTDSNKRETIGINFCSASLIFLKQLRGILYENSINSYIVDEKNKNTYRLYIKGLKNVDNMWNYMFDDAVVFFVIYYKKKEMLYKKHNIAQRLLRLSEMAG